MEWGQFYMLLGLTLYTIQFETVWTKSTNVCQDSLEQWEEHEWICGFSVSKLPQYAFSSTNSSNNSQIERSIVWNSNPFNISDSVIPEYSSDISINDGKTQNMRQIIISYENFKCCLKNIVMNIRNIQQREKCLASFLACVTKVETEKCTIQWRFYMNLILHDEKFMLVVIFILIAAFVAVLFSTYKCNNEIPTLGRENFQRY